MRKEHSYLVYVLYMYMSVVHHGGHDRCHLNGDHQHLFPLVGDAPVVLEDPRLQLVEVGQGGSVITPFLSTHYTHNEVIYGK